MLPLKCSESPQSGGGKGATSSFLYLSAQDTLFLYFGIILSSIWRSGCRQAVKSPPAASSWSYIRFYDGGGGRCIGENKEDKGG